MWERVKENIDRSVLYGAGYMKSADEKKPDVTKAPGLAVLAGSGASLGEDKYFLSFA